MKPIHHACQNGDADIVELLISRNIDVVPKNKVSKSISLYILN